MFKTTGTMDNGIECPPHIYSRSSEPPMSDPTSDRLYCYRCGYYWRIRSSQLPRTCPRCGSSRWNDPVRSDTVCRFCGSTWRLSSLSDPCPSCGHTILEAPDPSVLHCNRCDHEWRPRTDGRPRRCPLCKSTMWDSPRPVRYTCHACGRVWVGGGKRPARCPTCRSTLWDRPIIRVQCRVCGHSWALKGGRTTEDVGRCPKCRSAHWMEPPVIKKCADCGLSYVVRGGDRGCPQCKGYSDLERHTCGFCGMEWGTSDGSGSCPRCGRMKDSPQDRYIDLWSDGVLRLQYAFMDDFAFVYLWENSRPVAATYFHQLIDGLGMTKQKFVSGMNDGSLTPVLRSVSRRMSEHRFDYLDKVDYFMKRLGLDDDDAIILSLHFTGMGLEAISLHLKRPLKDIRIAFDRIMKAYEDSGIVVDDSVFTDDPFQYY